MIVYWSAREKNVARPSTGETAASRSRHQLLLNLALLLAFIRFPGRARDGCPPRRSPH